VRLACVEAGHGAGERAVLDEIEAVSGRPPSDVLRTLYYRPEVFGRPFSDVLELAMRGESDWSNGERELFAAFVSSLIPCPFRTATHGAVASFALGEEAVEAVYRDWRSAPVDAKVRATLGFLETLTLRPDELGPADADLVRGAGVGDQALVDAIHVGALFNMIVRLADSFGFEVPPAEALLARAEWRLNNGYALLPTG
jgi:uncharacterized peroxidase-related enzyme